MPPSELLVNGAPTGSIVFIDGVRSGQVVGPAKRSQILAVSPGSHTLEVRVGDTVAYRESTYVEAGKKRVITVLSGGTRN